MDKIINELGEWYAVRLSSFDSLGMEKTTDMLKDYRYILSEEGDGITTKYHQHIIWVYEGTIEQLRQIIKKTYPECSGNKCLYIKPSRDKKQLAKYTLKEGKYTYKGFDEKYIQEMFKCSKPKTDLKKDIADNEDDYIMDRKDLNQFIESYLLIKATHDQPIYMNHIESYIRKIMIKKNPKYAKGLTKVLLDRLQN